MELSQFQKQIIEILGLSQEEIDPISLEDAEGLYSTAYGLYEKGDYLSAAKLFTQLVLTDPFSENSWRGLASSQQMSERYLPSIHAWALAALLNETDPLPHFHAAECYLSLNEKEDALKALDAALILCPEESPLKEKIQLLKAIHHANP